MKFEGLNNQGKKGQWSERAKEEKRFFNKKNDDAQTATAE